MNDYFEGSVRQHLERGRRLLTRIPRNLPREFHLLAQNCERDVGSILDQLETLLSDARMRSAPYQPERLRQFRRRVREMNYLEVFGIAALERSNTHDAFLNQLIERIRIEISYPLLPPVVTSLSQSYFHIHPQLRLLSVPLSEGDFLLHLPDLYHELAHPLIIERHNPIVRPFQDTASIGIDRALGYIQKEQQKEDRRRSPHMLGIYLHTWEKSWWMWAIEFFCDLFAIYTTGPAFAWAHLHLFAKLGDNPYRVPTMAQLTHPADDARMKVMLFALNVAGFRQEADMINKRWNELVSLSGARPDPEYRRCFPNQILQQMAQDAYDGVSAIGCRIASPETDDPIYCVLNEAWTEFWRSPMDYVIWERGAVFRLRQLLSS